MSLVRYQLDLTAQHNGIKAGRMDRMASLSTPTGEPFFVHCPGAKENILGTPGDGANICKLMIALDQLVYRKVNR